MSDDDEIERLHAEIARLRAALEPFAKLIELIECTTNHTDHWEVLIDLRRKALAKETE